MLEITERLNLAERYDAVISLDYDSRKRGRLKTRLRRQRTPVCFSSGVKS